ncbi:MAG TPA: DMT family transporter, partial [Nitrospiria bacterium]|nr:DMT family transporter [Nitrospiria bacterium]
GTVSALALWPVVDLLGENALPVTMKGWMVLAGLAVISHGIGQSLIAYALAHLPAAFSSVGLLLQPVGAAALAWIILAEPLSGWQWLGGLIVLSGIYLARRGSL